MIRYFVGSPGSGKTTFAVYLIRKERKRYDNQYANFENTLSNEFDPQLLADFKPPEYSKLYIDESGIEFNSRDFKSMHKGIIEYFKLHRHNHNDVDIFSQTWDDTDKQIRTLANEIWLLKKVLCFTVARRVFIKIDINKETKQLEQQYSKTPILLALLFKDIKIIFRPLYYRYFDSYSPINRPTWDPKQVKIKVK